MPHLELSPELGEHSRPGRRAPGAHKRGDPHPHHREIDRRALVAVLIEQESLDQRAENIREPAHSLSYTSPRVADMS